MRVQLGTLGLAALMAFGAAAEEDKPVGVQTTAFGKLPDGGEAKLFTMKNKNGIVVKLTDYGARIVAVEMPDHSGKVANICLGFDSVEKYVEHTSYFGCTTGRYANRIAKGKFTLDGKEYTLAVNNGPNHLHGGKKGFDRQLWKGEAGPGMSVRFTHRSPDGDENYPGNLDVTVVYTLTDENALTIDYTAKTDKATVLNLTNHCYWNLGGAAPDGSILNHKLELTADKYVEVDSTLIPTGKLPSVMGTPLDFTKPEVVGARIDKLKEGPDAPGGYDHCYVLRERRIKPELAARIEDPKSGRTLEVHTTEPGVQFYTGNFLDGSAGSGGFQKHGAFCLETQHFPDSPNHKEFPSTELRPGQVFRSTTVHKFSAQ
jgi:Galactose mutarotase and related enzymes